MKAIIFGGGGQDGHYLARILRNEGIEVHALSHKDCNVGVQGYVYHEVARIVPDFIFHFAAQSTVRHDAIWENHKAIVDGTVNILEAARTYCPKAKVFLAGSILQFKGQSLIGMSNDLSNASIYVAQRHASVAYARYYRTLGMDVYVGYLSYHDSPLRGEQHLAKRIALEAKAVVAGKQPHLLVRDPLDEKEWNFAGDMMKAVWAQVNSGVYEAVLGSGKAHTIQAYAKACIRALDPSRLPNAIRQEWTREGPARSRTCDLRFSDYFTTTLDELAAMMVASA